MSGFRLSASAFSGWEGARRRSVRVAALRAWAMVARIADAAATRGELARLDARLLADIGLTRGEALAEATRAPWDTVPRLPPRPRWTPPARTAPTSSASDRLREAWRRRASRRLIAQLDQAGLRDIGVTWAEAEAEANKPWWRA